MNSLQEKLFLKYSELMMIVNNTNEDLGKLCLKNRVTSGRDLRRGLRNIKTLTIDMVRLANEIEKELREEKTNKKDD